MISTFSSDVELTELVAWSQARMKREWCWAFTQLLACPLLPTLSSIIRSVIVEIILKVSLVYKRFITTLSSTYWHSCGKRRCEWTGVKRSGGRHYLPPARQASQVFSTKKINCNCLGDGLEFPLPSVPCVTRTTPLWEEPLVASLHCAKTSLLYLEDHL